MQSLKRKTRPTSLLSAVVLNPLYDERPQPDVLAVQKVYSPKMASISVDSVLNRFRRVGALLEGHFRLTSGLHSSGFLQCALVLQHPRDAEACGEEIAATVRDLNAQTVLSPALGGIVIGQAVGRALGVRAIFAERQDGKLMLRRGFSLEP